MMKIKKRIKEIFSNKFNVILIAIVAIFTIYYAGFIANKLSGIRCFYNNSDSVSYIDISTPKKFSLLVKTDNLSAIQFPFIIENKDLTDEELKKLLFDVTINSSKNQYFSTEVLSNGEGEHFLKIHLAPRIHGRNHKKLDVSVSSNAGVSFLLDGSGNVIYKLNGLRRIVIFVIVFAFIALIACFYFVVFLTRKWKFENRFLLYALVLGVGYIFIRCPLTQCDEIYHYDTAYNMSNIMLGYGSAADNGTLLKRKCDLNLIPGFYPEFYKLAVNTYVRNGGRNYYNHLFSLFMKPVDEELTPSFDNRVMKPQRGFLFSSAAISLARLMHFNQFVTYYSGCIVNLIIAVVFIYLGIKYNKKYQYLFASVVFIPIALIDLGSYSYDVLLISLSFFIINMAFYIYNGHKKSVKAWIVFFVASLFLLPIKCVYFVIPFILFFLFFFSKNLKKRFLICLITVGVVYLFVLFLANFDVIHFFEGRSLHFYENERVSGFTYAIKDVVCHPVSFFSLIVSELMEQGYSQFSNFAPLYVPSLLSYFCGFSILMLFCTGSEEKNQSAALSSFIVFFIVSIFLCLVGIVWTVYGEFSLWGIQARYFFPVIPLLFIGVQNAGICNVKINSKIPFYLIFTVSFFFLVNLFFQTIFWVGSVE